VNWIVFRAIDRQHIQFSAEDGGRNACCALRKRYDHHNAHAEQSDERPIGNAQDKHAKASSRSLCHSVAQQAFLSLQASPLRQPLYSLTKAPRRSITPISHLPPDGQARIHRAQQHLEYE
jgi:hypothetical protein